MMCGSMLRIGSFVLTMAVSFMCLAQETAEADVVAAPAVEIVELTTEPICCRVVDGTLVTVEILDPLSSLHKRGDKFRLRLSEPLIVDGQTLLASGLEGVGEIVHAEKSRGGGKAGELLIAARYLDRSGEHIPLRGLKLGGSGKDNTAAAMAVSVALGPLAHFVRGREIEIPAGTQAQAKIAGSLDVLTTAQTQSDTAAVVASTAAEQTDPLATTTAESPASDSAPVPQSEQAANPEIPPNPVQQNPNVQPTQNPKE